MSSAVIERALVFGGRVEPLFGVLHDPSLPAETAIVVVVGGPQYRAGSHRQFVHLARAIAEAGYPVLRFDYRGMGDSAGEQRSFTEVSSDIRDAIDEVQHQLPSVRRIVLWGLCDGASAALLFCHSNHDPRVQGLCLANPWVRSAATLARTHLKHYYLRRMLERDFWVKLQQGKVGMTALAALANNIGLSLMKRRQSTMDHRSYQSCMAVALGRFNGNVLLLLSGNDLTAKEFIEHAMNDSEWLLALQNRGLKREDLPGIDHTFSDGAARARVQTLTVAWLAANRFGAAREPVGCAV